jgi:hypothetical protein
MGLFAPWRLCVALENTLTPRAQRQVKKARLGVLCVLGGEKSMALTAGVDMRAITNDLPLALYDHIGSK